MRIILLWNVEPEKSPHDFVSQSSFGKSSEETWNVWGCVFGERGRMMTDIHLYRRAFEFAGQETYVDVNMCF
jgi:hypothetical protein